MLTRTRKTQHACVGTFANKNKRGISSALVYLWSAPTLIEVCALLVYARVCMCAWDDGVFIFWRAEGLRFFGNGFFFVIAGLCNLHKNTQKNWKEIAL